MSLFSELKERNVFKVAVVYAALAWLMLQVIDTVQDPLRLPDWSLNLFLALALFGFPLALILAWALDLTTRGIQRADSAQTTTAAQIKFSLLVGVVLAAVGVGLWNNWHQAESEYVPAVKHSDNTEGLVSQLPVANQSIAVLPFVNMSGNPDNEYFSDGISEELLNGLTNLDTDLRVAARTSSFYFKGKDVDIATIGEKLNVATVLEGSVRRVGDRVRITAQLINVADGYHLWSETYDRQIDDIFAVQDEIARAIVAALEVKLGIQADTTLIGVHTSNPEAYAAFLQGRYHSLHNSPERALEQLQRAVELDPNLADAWGEIAAIYANLSVFKSWEDTMPHARRAFERALALEPDNGRGLQVKAGYTLRTTWNWPLAIEYFQRALASEADPADMATAYVNVILISVGQTQRAKQLYAEILANDPLNLQVKGSLMLMDAMAGKVPEVVERFKQLEPEVEDKKGLMLFRCMAHGLANDRDGLDQFIASYPVPLPCLMTQASLDEDATAINALLGAVELAGAESPLSRLAREVGYISRGRWEEAIPVLEEMHEHHDAGLRMIRTMHKSFGAWDELMEKPRYRALMEKINMDDASIAELERTIEF